VDGMASSRRPGRGRPSGWSCPAVRARARRSGTATPRAGLPGRHWAEDVGSVRPTPVGQGWSCASSA
jgi:hypothetical protein